MEFNERCKNILKAIIVSYIKSPCPVGSRTVTNNFGFGWSPATVRNTMADLEDMGYLLQPHTSAGRIPTERGYRFYVDTLLEELPKWDGYSLSQDYKLHETEDITGLLHETCKMLSIISHYAGIVVAPKFSDVRLTHIEFIRLKGHHILVLFVSEDGLVQNNIIDAENEFSQQELDNISSYLNKKLSGSTFQEIREGIIREMNEGKELYNSLLQKAINIREKVTDINNNLQSGVFLEGVTNMLNLPDFMADINKMKAVLTAFEEKYTILSLLDKTINEDGVQVFIGSENSFLGTGECSMVISNYKKNDKVIGSLGIIGPIRMEYYRVIPLVDYTAKLLGQLLTNFDKD